MELFKLLGTIAINNTNAMQAIDDTTENAKRSESKITSAFKKIGTAVVTYFAVDRIKAFGQALIDSYADYEQLIGGVETLFGAGGQSLEEYAESVGKTVDEVSEEYNNLMKSQEAVFNNASIAYKTAGMSANEYMETVTAFSASLIQSLGGDTEKAAKIADKAIIDMSDNANKMGSSMESIQNAYQGFAKQNYTMLDNLKLGYGGTKEEMERLLADAEAISGIHYDVSSYADVVEAIHVIQEEMGITGTTAKEASETISGSISSMKAAWKNLITGFGDENANLESLFGQFADSFITAAGNVVPRIGIIIENIGELIIKSIPKIIKKIPSVIDSISYTVKNSVGKMIENAFGTEALNVFEDAVNRLQEVFSSLQEAVRPITENILPMLSQIFESTMNEIQSVVIPVLEFLWNAFCDVADVVIESVKPAIEKISKTFSELFRKMSDLYNEYVLPVLNSFIEMISELWNENKDKIAKIGELFETVFNLISDLVGWFCNNVLKGVLFEGIKSVVSFVSAHMDTFKSIFQKTFDVIGEIVQFFIDLFSGNWSALWDDVIGVLGDAKDLIGEIFGLIFDIASSIWSKIKEKISEIIDKIVTGIKEKFNNAKETALGIFRSLKNTLGDIFSGIWNVIKRVLDKIIGGVNDMVGGIIDAVETALEWLNKLFGAVTKSVSSDLIGKMGGGGVTTVNAGAISTIPKMATGGVLEKGQVGFLEGDGAEAVVPLEQNKKWIQRVANEFQTQGFSSNNEELKNAINEGFNQLIGFLMQYMPQIARMQLVMDSGAVVGEIAPLMDEALGKLSDKNGRSV